MVVADSSTLILLAKAGLLDLVLEKSREKIIIPPVVYAECLAKKEADDAQLIKRRVEKQEIIVKYLKQKGIVSHLQEDFALGKGEAEALALCLEKKEALMTDDKKAILACKTLHIPFTTAMNILVELKKRGYLSGEYSLVLFRRLQEHGRYGKELVKRIEEDLL